MANAANWGAVASTVNFAVWTAFFVGIAAFALREVWVSWKLRKRR